GSGVTYTVPGTPRDRELRILSPRLRRPSHADRSRRPRHDDLFCCSCGFDTSFLGPRYGGDGEDLGHRGVSGWVAGRLHVADDGPGGEQGQEGPVGGADGRFGAAASDLTPRR